MRSESSCSKGKLVFHLSALLVLCSLLIGMTACGSAPEAGQATDSETNTGNEETVVMSDTTEEKTEQVNTTENNGKSIDQAPATTDTVPETIVPDDETRTENDDMKKLRMEINGTEVAVAWEDNESVSALTELAEKDPITIQMSMYGGFEQVGPLGTSLPRNDKQTTTSAGDIVLYSGNQLVVFYGSNSWSYTRLGHVELSAAEMTDLLSPGDVTITLSVE